MIKGVEDGEKFHNLFKYQNYIKLMVEEENSDKKPDKASPTNEALIEEKAEELEKAEE